MMSTYEFTAIIKFFMLTHDDICRDTPKLSMEKTGNSISFHFNVSLNPNHLLYNNGEKQNSF